MNNTDFQMILSDCQIDLNAVSLLVNSLGYSNDIVPYLSKYAIIKACGSVEVAFKSIITDFLSNGATIQIRFYLSSKIRKSSRNPSYDNICSLLNEFDTNWNTEFKDRVKADPNYDRLKTSMQSLVDARNEFAHGGSPNVVISDITTYFTDFQTVLKILDNVLS